MGYNHSAVTLQGELSQSTAPRYVIWCVLEWGVSSAAGGDAPDAGLCRHRSALLLQPHSSVQPPVGALTEINKASTLAFPKMLHDTSEGCCVWGCSGLFLSPHKAFQAGSATAEIHPSLLYSSYHCFSFIGQIFNDVWWSGSQPALASANTTHPPLFFAG